MAWQAPIVGYVDSLGYLRCTECASEDKREHAVHGDQYFGTDDICERCGTSMKHVPTSEYVRVALGYSAPDISHTA